MDHNCRDRISLILFPLVFILAATYRTILFDEQFDELFDENNGVLGELNLMKIEANWNWTLFAKKGFPLIDFSFGQSHQWIRLSQSKPDIKVRGFQTHLRNIISASIRVVKLILMGFLPRFGVLSMAKDIKMFVKISDSLDIMTKLHVH